MVGGAPIARDFVWHKSGRVNNSNHSLDKQLSEKCFESSVAEWNNANDINEQNLKIKLKLSLDMAKFGKEVAKNLTDNFKWESFQDADLLRMYKKMSVLGSAALPEDTLQEVADICTQ